MCVSTVKRVEPPADQQRVNRNRLTFAVRQSTTTCQQRLTISQVAADRHELMIPQRIMRASIVRASEQPDPRCSMQTYHRPNQPHEAFTP